MKHWAMQETTKHKDLFVFSAAKSKVGDGRATARLPTNAIALPDPKSVRTDSDTKSSGALHSAELKGPRKLLRIRPGIFDLEPDLGLKLGQTKPKIS